MEDDQWMIKARTDYDKYCKDSNGKMEYEDFEKFLEFFLSDQPEEIRNSFQKRKFFEEYATKNKNEIEKPQFEQAWEELNLRRLETKDQLDDKEVDN
jgi:hypothetical protein